MSRFQFIVCIFFLIVVPNAWSDEAALVRHDGRIDHMTCQNYMTEPVLVVCHNETAECRIQGTEMRCWDLPVRPIQDQSESEDQP